MDKHAKLFGFDSQLSFKTFQTEHPSTYSELFSQDISTEIGNLEDHTTELELRIRRHVRTVFAKNNLPSISVYCQGVKAARLDSLRQRKREAARLAPPPSSTTLTPPSTPTPAPTFNSLISPKRRLFDEDLDIDGDLDDALPPSKRHEPELPLISELDSLRARVAHLEAESTLKDATIAKLTGQLKSGICRFCGGSLV